MYKKVNTKMKVICILQNAWGDRKLPVVFIPHPGNKSARTIKKKVLTVDDIMHFANTTGVVTPTAKGKPPIDLDHFQKVLNRIAPYDLILVCGKQAAKLLEQIKAAHPDKPLVEMPHPACRTLSNVQLEEIKATVNQHRKADESHEDSLKFIMKTFPREDLII